MIFAIIGIVILVVSFVIALITLVREQNKLNDAEIESVESDMATAPERFKKVILDPDLTHRREEPKPYAQPLDVGGAHNALDSEILSEGSHNIESVQEAETIVGKPNVWWERLDDAGENLEEKNEDEKSIEKIREELAKLMSTKTPASAPMETEEENLLVEKNQNPESNDLRAKTIAGEFSLREIKKKS